MKNKIQIINLCGDDNEYLESLVSRVLNRCEIRPDNPVIIDDWDLDRVYLTIDDQDYTIRMWNIRETERMVIIDWTLFLFKENESCGTRIEGGVSRFRISK